MLNSGRDNVLVMQSGGCTPVINASLAGIVRAVSESRAFGKLYGAEHGLRGLLAGRLFDLSAQRSGTWRAIERQPAAVLGSARRKLRPEDEAPVLEALERRSIGYLFVIGGNDSAETAYRLSALAGGRLKAVLVPKTVDNDLPLTDHSPGYGSAARFVALATLGAGRDAEAMGVESPITVIEVMGRNAGWLAAAAALARRDERDAPHVICMPERPVNEERFLARVEEAYRRFGYALAVVGENVRGPDGPLGGQREPFFVDEFGHQYYEGAGRYLAQAIGKRLKARARYERPGTIQRSTIVSSVDRWEAYSAGQQAVRYALEGLTDVMVSLARATKGPYRCDMEPAPLAGVAAQEKLMPAEFIGEDGFSITQAFIDYARPLIGGEMPRVVRLGYEHEPRTR